MNRRGLRFRIHGIHYQCLLRHRPPSSTHCVESSTHQVDGQLLDRRWLIASTSGDPTICQATRPSGTHGWQAPNFPHVLPSHVSSSFPNRRVHTPGTPRSPKSRSFRSASSAKTRCAHLETYQTSVFALSRPAAQPVFSLTNRSAGHLAYPTVPAQCTSGNARVLRPDNWDTQGSASRPNRRR